MGFFKEISSYFRPKFGDCTHHLNCHLRRFKPSFIPFREAKIPGQFYIGDIDGILALEDSNLLFLEFKTEKKELARRQLKAYELLSTKEGQDALIVWHETGFIDTPTSCQFIVAGKKEELIELTDGRESLIDVMKAWASQQPAPQDVRAMSAELDRMKVERDNLIYNVLFGLEEISALREGRSLDLQRISNALREEGIIDWSYFYSQRIIDLRSEHALIQLEVKNLQKERDELRHEVNTPKVESAALQTTKKVPLYQSILLAAALFAFLALFNINDIPIIIDPNDLAVVGLALWASAALKSKIEAALDRRNLQP